MYAETSERKYTAERRNRLAANPSSSESNLLADRIIIVVYALASTAFLSRPYLTFLPSMYSVFVQRVPCMNHSCVYINAHVETCDATGRNPECETTVLTSAEELARCTANNRSILTNTIFRHNSSSSKLTRLTIDQTTATTSAE